MESLLFRAIHGEAFQQESDELKATYHEDLNTGVLTSQLVTFDIMMKTHHLSCFRDVLVVLKGLASCEKLLID